MDLLSLRPVVAIGIGDIMWGAHPAMLALPIRDFNPGSHDCKLVTLYH